MAQQGWTAGDRGSNRRPPAWEADSTERPKSAWSMPPDSIGGPAGSKPVRDGRREQRLTGVCERPRRLVPRGRFTPLVRRSITFAAQPAPEPAPARARRFVGAIVQQTVVTWDPLGGGGRLGRVPRVLWTVCLGLQTQDISGALAPRSLGCYRRLTAPRSWTTLTPIPSTGRSEIRVVPGNPWPSWQLA
jgi:hypothetical protein